MHGELGAVERSLEVCGIDCASARACGTDGLSRDAQIAFRQQCKAPGGVELWGVLAYSSNPQISAQASQNNNLGTAEAHSGE
jgi:hypothetical protein